MKNAYTLPTVIISTILIIFTWQSTDSTAMVSALMTAVFMNLAAYIKDDKEKQASQKKEQSDLANAILAELDAIRTVYEPLKLTEHTPENQNDVAVSHLGQEYLTVYKQNASKLGLFRQTDATAVIELYVTIMGLMDSLAYLSARLTERTNYQQTYSAVSVSDSSKSSIIDKDVKNAYVTAYNYQEKIRNAYPKVKQVLEQYR